jgi:uncharacterized protein DUF6454
MRPPPEKLRTLITSHYLDHQDCKYSGRRRMLCTGSLNCAPSRTLHPSGLGASTSSTSRTADRCTRSPYSSGPPPGLDMTHNPVWIEPSATGLRSYFMPEDDKSTLYIYEVALK